MSIGVSSVPQRPADKPKRNDITVRVDAAVIRQAKALAGFHGENLAEYLSHVLAPVVQREYEQMTSGKLKPRNP